MSGTEVELDIREPVDEEELAELDAAPKLVPPTPVTAGGV